MEVDPSTLPSGIPLPTTYPMVTFRYIEHLWIAGLKEEAFQQLHHFTHVSLHPNNIQILVQDEIQQQQQRDELNKLLSRCYLKLGQWQENLNGITEESIPMILQYYYAATERDRDWYKGWHAWAYMNFEAVHFYKAQVQQLESQNENVGSSPINTLKPMKTRYIRDYCVPAIQGFFKSVSLAHGSSLQVNYFYHHHFYNFN